MPSTAELPQLRVDKAFAALCPDLTPEEMDLLEASLEKEGCREPVMVWANHDDTILDGHNRYRICKRFKIPFRTKALKFETREEAANWIIQNALGRRNLNEEQKSYLRGKRYNAEKKPAHRPTEEEGGHNGHLKTAERLAEELNVPERTIRRDARFAAAVDTLAENVGPNAKKAILSGSLGANKKEVIALATLPESQQKKAIAGGKEAVKKAAKAAIEKQRPDWAQGPTPQEQAQNDPGRRWHQSLHKLYVLLTSVRDAGGIVKLARKWKPESKDDNLAELKRISGELTKWISALEDV